jgi:hydrogenase-4 membrane subunit HyfE
MPSGGCKTCLEMIKFNTEAIAWRLHIKLGMVVKVKKSTKKLIAPVVIVAVLTVYLIAFAIAWSYVELPLLVKIAGVVIPIALIGVGIFVLVERIKEVRSGEEDDLSKY